MEIITKKSGEFSVVVLNGRLDANWCEHVQNALASAVRAGEHRIHLDMAAVSYVSSAGLRVLLTVYKQLRGIHGIFGVVNASEAVRGVLELAGLDMLLVAPSAASAASTVEPPVRTHASPSAKYEIFSSATPASPASFSLAGKVTALAQGATQADARHVRFGAGTFALGVGALGASYADSAPRFGELLAIAGIAAFQPADGSSRPDFMVTQGALVPEGHLILGVTGEATFSTLARFEANKEARAVRLTELAQTALELSGASAAVVVAFTETAGLVGATLRRSPATAGTEKRFTFPEIRDWLSFTSERAFRDSASLIVGIVAKPGTALDPLLRPLAPASGLLGHFHAASFPYRPIRKGRLELAASVAELFEGHALQAVLHLLADTREFNGAGESDFYRGALWIAPLNPAASTP